ncbi:hypothetical protein [Actinomadura citrea]|jgi:shikimate kinase|uniref:Shikimate kinase n=1 Tax=Actinomadura citrea TaxID=46158 RepID=A0A7Y9GIV8_9ACTN|nr:hypothetical protein [Actinomadura citrea]NYE17338.1 shikimate kinase [Actinomadura citrea]GGT93348.1 hypothetical protein GCM10010177_60910 [Actinomadura citrea]
MAHTLDLSGDPRAAAEQALHLAGDVSGAVELSFTGTLDDVFEGEHHQGLTVTVNPGTSVDEVVADLREAAQPQR